MIFNSGHPNIDNNAEYHAGTGQNVFNSFRLDYYNKWFFISIEPYNVIRKENQPISNENLGNYKYLNNQSIPYINRRQYEGLRLSTVMIHHYGLGLAYSNASQWWGPGMHSSIALSSNSIGFPHYSIGTYPEIKIKKFGIGIKAIAAQYENHVEDNIFFSGLSAYATYYSNPTITLGLFRTYMSGNFDNLKDDTLFKDDWTLNDAARLLIEPLFGQNKSGLKYTMPGTPGFDKWDEILSGYINITFPNELLKVYAELASDDNRGNFTDLRAHWDHTLGYLIGFRKYFIVSDKKYFIGFESISTKISNTYNKIFWRGDPNQDNYYTREYYDYFSYGGRMMGAHSGASSDDKILAVGYMDDNNRMILVNINWERHGIKSKLYPETKTELTLSYNQNFFKNHSFFINVEHEKIDNYSFIKDSGSVSNIIWLGYSFSFR